MEKTSVRTVVNQLGDDLHWLEQHSKEQTTQSLSAIRLRLAGALIRNCIGPMLDDQPPTPLHVAVIGGAGAGKSTVANMLSGAVAAETNPQAGYTRHPIAFTSSNAPTTWTGHLGFLGPLQKLTHPAPSSLDQDVYQVRHIPVDATQNIMKDFIVWDCPDMTTWASTGYIPRLVEIAGLADVLIYVASDERYNDEIPTQFLRLFVQAGKPILACLTKMREPDAESLISHFQKEVVAHLPGKLIGTIAIPHLTVEQLANPAQNAPRYRVPLINQIAVLGSSPAVARRRSVQAGMKFLKQTEQELLSVAKRDLEALDAWQDLVRQGQTDFNTRYFREYLTAEKFTGFNEALVHLLDLLDFPGVGKFISGALYVIRTPFRLLGKLVGKAMQRPDAGHRPELPVMEEALTGWLDKLRREAAARAENHQLWGHVSRGFQSGLGDLARERFHQAFRQYQVGVSAEVERTARAIYEELEKNPAVLNTLRGSKLAVDVAAIGGTLLAGGIALHDIILVPVVATLTQKLVELLGRGFVDAQREMTRRRQHELMNEQISTPLTQWLIHWPSTGGTSFERLQQVLKRLPQNLASLDAMVQERLKASGG